MLRIAAFTVLGVYSFISLFAFISGFAGANGLYTMNIDIHCTKEPRRAEPLFPAYKLGCYLGASLEPYYYEGELK